MFNWKLARQAMQQIHEHPDAHNQGYWWRRTECGTTMCFAGWVAHLSGWEPNIDPFGVVKDANFASCEGYSAEYPDIARDELNVGGGVPDDDFAYETLSAIMYDTSTEEEIAEKLFQLSRQDTELQTEAWLENETRSAA